ncbi:MAG: isochorismate synthase [Bacteroidota bacterium]
MQCSEYLPDQSELHGKMIPGAFAVYRLPLQKVKVIMSGNARLLSGTSGFLTGRPGFVMAPFYADSPNIWLEADKISSSSESVIKIPSGKGQIPVFEEGKIIEVQEHEYIMQVNKIIELIHAGHAGKVVLSRQLSKMLNEDFNATTLFNLLCSLYPEAFVYLIFIPGYAIWTGASPETLLRRRSLKISTMALAGTRLAEESGQWGIKETEEHSIVVDYIQKVLKESGCKNIYKSEPSSVNAGRVMHLCTRFEAGFQSDSLPLIISALHPTPAVCGWPADKAMEIIRKTEKHNRSYYAGYLGPVGPESADLFVNLRCLQLFKGRAVIYTGGGLTSASNPQAEWDETVLKSTTMLSAIEKMQNLAV